MADVPLPAWTTPLLDAGQQRAVDSWAIESGEPGIRLMERAGAGLVDRLVERVPDGRVAVVCGKGNNGGDGLVVARRLRELGRDVDVLMLAPGDKLGGDARANFERLPGAAAMEFSASALDRAAGDRRRDPRHRLLRRAP